MLGKLQRAHPTLPGHFAPAYLVGSNMLRAYLFFSEYFGEYTVQLSSKMKIFWIKSVSLEYSCYEGYLEEFNNGKMSKYSHEIDLIRFFQIYHQNSPIKLFLGGNFQNFTFLQNYFSRILNSESFPFSKITGLEFMLLPFYFRINNIRNIYTLSI